MSEFDRGDELDRPTPFFLAALSSTMTEGKIVSWLKQAGDKVKKGEVRPYSPRRSIHS